MADSGKLQQTEYAIVYLHGFSASKEEGNPAYHYLAKALKAKSEAKEEDAKEE